MIFLIFLITLAFIFFGLLLLNIQGGVKLLLFSPTGLTLLYILAKILPGFYISMETDSTLNSLFALLIFVIGFFIAIICSTYFVTQTNSVAFKNSSQPLEFSEKTAWTVIIIGCISFVLVYIMFGNAPILYFFKNIILGDYSITMQQARMNNTLQHYGDGTIYFGQGYFKFIYQTIAPLFVAGLYIYKKINNEGSQKKIVYLMFLYLIFSVFNGQVKPLIVMLLFFAVIALSYNFIFNRTPNHSNNNLVVIKLLSKLFLIYTIIVLSVILLRYAQSLSGRYIEDIVTSALDRIFYLPANVLFDRFPNSYEFRLGQTWINDLSGLLPGSIKAFNYEVYILVYGTTGGFTLSPGLILSSYINFGFLGIFFLSFVLSTIYQIIFIFMSINRSIEIRVLSVLTSLSFALSLSSDIVSAVIPLIFIAVIFAITFLSKARFFKIS